MMKEVVLPLGPADARTFRGEAYSAMIAGAETEVPVKLYYVRFEPGARTNWHSHSGPQVIVVVAGRCRYQIGDDAVREIGPGESVRFEPGARHWHGAADRESAEHIAINLDNRSTRWLEAVSDGEYGGLGPAA